MINNETNNLIQQEKPENPIINNLDDIDDDMEFNNSNNNANSFFRQRTDSTNPQSFNYKFSIDQPNIPKQRLNEFLNNDLINALEVSPSMSKLNSGINDNVQNNNNIGDNNPQNLFGFSLYSQPNKSKFWK